MGNTLPCPSQDLIDNELASDSTYTVVGQVRDGGQHPHPRFWAFLQSCQTSGSVNPLMPCPYNAGDEHVMNCECGVYQEYLWDVGFPEKGPICLSTPNGNSTAAQASIGVGLQTDEFAYSILMQHETTWARIVDLCGGSEDLANDLWPHFYHMYNIKYGKNQVDDFIANSKIPVPQAAIDALKANYTDDVQKLYGLMNGYDWQNSQAYFSSGLYQFNTVGANQLQYVGYDLKKVYKRMTIGQTDFTGGYFGNPFWDHNEWQEAFRKVLGTIMDKKSINNGKDFIDAWAQAYVDEGLIGPGKSADDYFDPSLHPGTKNPFTDPDYTGQLPALVPLNKVGQEMIHRETKDPTAHGYDSPCGKADITSTLLPIFAGVIGGGISSMIIPGIGAKFGAFATGFYACYETVDSVYGFDAMVNQDTVNQYSGEKKAALALSVAMPVCAAGGLIELGWVPESFQTTTGEIAFMGAVGGLGFFILKPAIEPLLVEGGAVAETLLSPLSVVTGFVHWIADGCASHEVYFHITCKCENSNTKPLMRDALLQDLYGVTDQQLALRTGCMNAAMTTGLWGSDPVFMGSCDGKGWMSTPTACVSAGEWAYQIWDPSLDSLCNPMWSQISHCVDPYNASFLPPLPEDAPCVSKYGKYARQGGIKQRPGDTTQCYDYRAPPGTQELGVATSYKWPSSSSTQTNECNIL